MIDSEGRLAVPNFIFVRGKATQGAPVEIPDSLCTQPLGNLTESELETVFCCGVRAGLRLHKFKRAIDLPRVRRVFGILKSLAPANLLDMGSGRGVFLWPLLEEFPHLPVTAIDHNPQRAEDIQAVRLSGVEHLVEHTMDATQLEFAAGSFDVVTLLEVLGHIPKVERALAETVRMARRAVVLSVPSKEDENPEHIHLFDQKRLRMMFETLDVRRMRFDYVPGHLIAVASLGHR